MKTAIEPLESRQLFALTPTTFVVGRVGLILRTE